MRHFRLKKSQEGADAQPFWQFVLAFTLGQKREQFFVRMTVLWSSPNNKKGSSTGADVDATGGLSETRCVKNCEFSYGIHCCIWPYSVNFLRRKGLLPVFRKLDLQALVSQPKHDTP